MAACRQLSFGNLGAWLALPPLGSTARCRWLPEAILHGLFIGPPQISVTCREATERGRNSSLRGSIGAITAEIEGKGFSLGTGFKIGANLILTADHVVAQGNGLFSTGLTNVNFFPGRASVSLDEIRNRSAVGLKATVVASGKGGEYKNDWAILRVEEPPRDEEQASLLHEEFSSASVIPLIAPSSLEGRKFVTIESWGYSSKCQSNDYSYLTALRGAPIGLSEKYGTLKRIVLWVRGIEEAAHVSEASEGLSGGPVLALDETGATLGAIGVAVAGADDVLFFTSTSHFWKAYQSAQIQMAPH